ncbi:MAG: hypothetical protein AVDCRST_MAG08-1128, partial [uncultured Acetobacteraceae bacterium]
GGTRQDRDWAGPGLRCVHRRRCRGAAGAPAARLRRLAPPLRRV